MGAIPTVTSASCVGGLAARLLVATSAVACTHVTWMEPRQLERLAAASTTRLPVPVVTTMGKVVELEYDDTLVFLDREGKRTPNKSYTSIRIENDILVAQADGDPATRVPLSDLAAIGVVDYWPTVWVVLGSTFGAATVVLLIAIFKEGGLGPPATFGSFPNWD